MGLVMTARHVSKLIENDEFDVAKKLVDKLSIKIEMEIKYV
jgi:hypothetical protein